MCESFSLSRSLSLYVCVNAYTWLCVLGSFAGVVWRGCRAWLRANPEKATLAGETERMRHVGRKRDREGESSTGRIDSGWIPSRSRAPRRGAPLFLLGATPIRSISRSVSFQRPSRSSRDRYPNTSADKNFRTPECLLLRKCGERRTRGSLEMIFSG